MIFPTFITLFMSSEFNTKFETNWKLKHPQFHRQSQSNIDFSLPWINDVMKHFDTNLSDWHLNCFQNTLITRLFLSFQFLNLCKMSRVDQFNDQFSDKWLRSGSFSGKYIDRILKWIVRFSWQFIYKIEKVEVAGYQKILLKLERV